MSLSIDVRLSKWLSFLNLHRMLVHYILASNEDCQIEGLIVLFSTVLFVMYTVPIRGISCLRHVGGHLVVSTFEKSAGFINQTE